MQQIKEEKKPKYVLVFLYKVKDLFVRHTLVHLTLLSTLSRGCVGSCIECAVCSLSLVMYTLYTVGCKL